MKKDNFVTAVSIYSSRVSACIARAGEDGFPSIIGLGRSEGRFLGGAGVLDIDNLSKAVRDALKAAEEEAGVVPTRALVSISGGAVGSERSRGMVKLSQRGEEISERIVRNVLKAADTAPISIEREVIHSIPQDFTVDGQIGIKNPVGLYGVTLEVETLLISIHVPFLHNVAKCLNLAGVDLEEAVFSGAAASRCVLPFDKNGGECIILMEIDNNFTALSFFYDKVLRGIDVYDASVIKDGALGVLKEKIDKLRSHRPVSKIILAGGSYVHEDFIEKVDSVLGIPSQMAYVRNVRGIARDINSPAYITSIGLALYGIEKQHEGRAGKKVNIGFLKRAARRVGDFLTDYF